MSNRSTSMMLIATLLALSFILSITIATQITASPSLVRLQQQPQIQSQQVEVMEELGGAPIPDGVLQIASGELTTIKPTADKKPVLRLLITGMEGEYDEDYNGYEYDFDFLLNYVTPTKNQCFATLILGELTDLKYSARLNINIAAEGWSNTTRVTFPSRRDSYDNYDDKKPDAIKTSLKMYIHCEIESYQEGKEIYLVNAKLTSVKSTKAFTGRSDPNRTFITPLTQTPLTLSLPKTTSTKPTYKPFSFTVTDIKEEGLKYLLLNVQEDRGGAWSTTQIDWFSKATDDKNPTCTLNNKSIPVLVSVFPTHDIEFLIDNMAAGDKPKITEPWVFDCKTVTMLETQQKTNLRVKLTTVNHKPTELQSFEYIQSAPQPSPSPGPDHKETELELWKKRAYIAIGFAVFLAIVAVGFAIAFFLKKRTNDNNSNYGSLNV